jgi:DNA-binding NarL/FixJ family response regulator
MDKLTAREVEILTLLMTPRSVSEIAAELCIATSTLRTHLRNIYDKLGVHSRIEAVSLAREW